MRRQPRRLRGLDLDAHEDHLARVVHLRPLSRRLEERGQDQGLRRLRARHARQRVHAVTHAEGAAVTGELPHEGEQGGDAAQAVARLQRAHDARGGEDDPRMAGQGEAEAMQGAPPRVMALERSDGRPRERVPEVAVEAVDLLPPVARPARWVALVTSIGLALAVVVTAQVLAAIAEGFALKRTEPQGVPGDLFHRHLPQNPQARPGTAWRR